MCFVRLLSGCGSRVDNHRRVLATLAAGLAKRKRVPDELKADVMDVIVEYGGLDGVHMTNVATVDGLEPDRYFKQVGQLTDCARS
ncbi:MAG: hypothetical protein ACLU7B_01670 [Bifidobacterium adolescentis]